MVSYQMICTKGFRSFLDKSFISYTYSSAGNRILKSTCKKGFGISELSETCQYNLRFSSLNMSWSRLLICCDGDAHVFGFLEGKSGEIIILKTPDKSQIFQGCCSDNHCHLVTDTGTYWLYNINSKEWRNLNHLLGSGQDLETSDSSSPVSELFVYQVSCSDYMNVAVTNKGIYSVPLLLSFPQVKVLDVCCGKEHAILLTEHYSVFSWGSGEEDTFCIDKAKTSSAVSVLAEPRPVDWPDEQAIVEQVACGSQHTVAVLGDNSVWGCGWNKYGQLMEGGVPEKVFGMTKLSIPDTAKKKVRVFCGHWNSVFVT